MNHYTDAYYERDDSDYDYPDSIMSKEQEEELDDYVNSRGGIDKCMVCGRYKYGDELTGGYQHCIKPCRNPNEY